MEFTDEMKQKAIDAFITSMEKSGANAAVSQYFLAMDAALTDAMIAVVSDLQLADPFEAGDRVEVVSFDVEEEQYPVRVGMQGKVISFSRYGDGEADTLVKLDEVGKPLCLWFYGYKELKKIDA